MVEDAAADDDEPVRPMTVLGRPARAIVEYTAEDDVNQS